MKVALLRDLATENWPSIQIYSDQLAQHLRVIAPELELIEVNVPTWALPTFRLPTPYGRVASLRTLGVYLSRWIRYPSALRRIRADIYHILDNSYGHLAYFLDRHQTVITYHGGSGLPEKLAQWNPRGPALYLYSIAFRGMLRCERIIPNSEFGKRELIERTRFPANRVHVALHGVMPNFHPLTDHERAALRARFLHGDERYLILHVGNNEPRKNIPTLYRALGELRRRDCAARLVRIGALPTAEETQLLDELAIAPHVTHIQRVPNAELHSYYGAADVFVFPSLYEGFGIPPLEAMAAGTPVVCANASSLPEICSDAAILTDPNDAVNLAEAIERIFSDASLVEDLCVRGLNRAKMFTWEKCARETLRVYREL